jgi:hypothetical protein
MWIPGKGSNYRPLVSKKQVCNISTCVKKDLWTHREAACSEESGEVDTCDDIVTECSTVQIWRRVWLKEKKQIQGILFPIWRMETTGAANYVAELEGKR